MRSPIISSTIIAVLCTAIGANTEENKTVQYGKYVCITDRAVGLQTSNKTKERFAGKIALLPEHQRFLSP